jgi:putative ABC transport system substrate-binding protein
MGLALAVPAAARAAKAEEIPLVGMLRVAAAASYDPALDALRDALAARGYREGVNIMLEPHFANGNPGQLHKLAEELVRAQAKVIVAVNEVSLRAAKAATATIPIVVIAYDHDPVARGLIDNATHPGENVTGIFSRQIELAGKRLELLKEALPSLSRVALIYDVSRASGLSELDQAAAQLNLRLQRIGLKAAKDIDGALRRARRESQAALLAFSPMLYASRQRIATLASSLRLPLMTQQREFVLAGALLSYAPDRAEVAGRAAYLIDRLLRGAKPGDLPVEEAAKFRLIVNRKTARALGLEIPDPILLRADEVIS